MYMLGRRPPTSLEQASEQNEASPGQEAFDDAERNMVSGVLTLADRSIHSIMTPRNDITWLNLDDDVEKLREQLASTPHSFFPVCRGALDEVVGIGRAKELIADLITHGTIRLSRLRDPLIVPESMGILKVMETLKRAKGQLVLVADEFGAIEGVVTPIDVFEAIAGEFPDEDEQPDIVQIDENRWRVDGAADLHHLEQVLNADGLVDDDEVYSTLAGYLLERFGHLPAAGDRCALDQPHALFHFVVERVDGRRIAVVLIERTPRTESENEADDAV